METVAFWVTIILAIVLWMSQTRCLHFCRYRSCSELCDSRRSNDQSARQALCSLGHDARQVPECPEAPELDLGRWQVSSRNPGHSPRSQGQDDPGGHRQRGDKPSHGGSETAEQESGDAQVIPRRAHANRRERVRCQARDRPEEYAEITTG